MNNWMNWIIFFFVIQLFHFLGTWRLYQKSGRKAWEAAIPVYNAWVLMGIIRRPKWWVLTLFIPVINLLVFPVIWVEIARSFRKFQDKDTWLAILSLGFYNFYLNYIIFDELRYNEERSINPPNKMGEWISSIVFSIAAATFIHTYVIQPFTIPTGSLEKSLLIGDFLFVSKFHYGARVPISPIAVPMVHDSIPKTSLRSYIKGIELPYLRLPGFQKIKRNEMVVFNWPSDSLALMWGDRSGKFTYKPIDKKTNYVKRCVAIPGDTLEIKDGEIFINNKKSILPERAKIQFNYRVSMTAPITKYDFFETYHINLNDITLLNRAKTEYLISLDEERILALQKDPRLIFIKKEIESKGDYNFDIFPHDVQYPWNRDNFGPIYIPKKGDILTLNQKTLPFYRRIILEYEKNDFQIKDDQVYINGQRTNKYLVKQDYYWMMGDNRKNSKDAREWGYTPFDHVIGKPVFIWMSFDKNQESINKKIRWNRLCTIIHGEGVETSYFIPFLIILAIYYLGRKIYKKIKGD